MGKGVRSCNHPTALVACIHHLLLAVAPPLQEEGFTAAEHIGLAHTAVSEAIKRIEEKGEE